MRICVNGAERELTGAPSIAELLAVLDVRGRIAVEVNGELVPRSRHASHVLVEGDRIEIVQAIGGGDVHHPGAATAFAAAADESPGTSI